MEVDLCDHVADIRNRMLVFPKALVGRLEEMNFHQDVSDVVWVVGCIAD